MQMQAPRILLLEDDPAIGASVAFALQREGFSVEQVLLVREAQQRIEDSPPALVVLDLGLPDGSGLDLCQALRRSPRPELAALPLLVLTARSEEIDRVLGLELGADDYMAKPFSPRELVARVRALLRRTTRPAAMTAVPAGLGFHLDEAAQRVRYGGQWLVLTKLEYRLLCALLAAPHRIHSRDSLLDLAWGRASEATDRTVDTHIKTLRAKLREARPGHDPIATHRGLGYGLVDGA